MRAKKQFGQNFLVNAGVVNKIVSAIELYSPVDSDPTLLEIGPGPGALTESLLKKKWRVKAIEIDRDMVTHLSEKFAHELSEERFSIIESDALKVEKEMVGQVDTVCGNLPYNVGTEILFRVLFEFEHRGPCHFMLQKEVVDRLRASPRTKAYGALSVAFQSLCSVEQVFNVSPGSFQPIPKVDSAFISFIPLAKALVSRENWSEYRSFLNRCFSQRRKMLKHQLPKEFSDEVAGRRAEELSVEEFVDLYRRIHGR